MHVGEYRNAENYFLRGFIDRAILALADSLRLVLGKRVGCPGVELPRARVLE